MTDIEKIENIKESLSSGCDDFEAAARAEVSILEFDRLCATQGIEWANQQKLKAHALTANAKVTLARKLKGLDDSNLSMTVLERKAAKDWGRKLSIDVAPGSQPLREKSDDELKRIIDAEAVRIGSGAGEEGAVPTPPPRLP
jgi:hypothetical protein